MEKGIVFDIQRFALHDGPGIRTLVFLKGCPLRCVWCSNPESQSHNPQLIFYPDKCIGCGACVQVCPAGAVQVENDTIRYIRENCTNCLECTKNCPSLAREKCGELFTVDRVVREVVKDVKFYKKSGGGITLTGGEPLYQAEFAAALLKACKERHLHTALETTGYGIWRDFSDVLIYTDLVLFDIKHMNPDIHKRLTGVDNKLILNNMKKVARMKIALTARLPLIPGLNDSISNLNQTAEFIKGLETITELHILPYHKLGIYKYGLLAESYALGDLDKPGDDEVEKITVLFERHGLNVKIGG